MKLNNTPPPDITSVHVTEDRLAFDLEDGRSVSVPLAFYPTLLLATPIERAQFEISHSSVYWPELDCDISSACLLSGAKEARKYAERSQRRKEVAAAKAGGEAIAIVGEKAKTGARNLDGAGRRKAPTTTA